MWNRQHRQTVDRVMQSKYPGRCARCGHAIAIGEIIRFRADNSGKQVTHETQQQCDAARAAAQAAERVGAPNVDTHAIVDFLKAAQQRGLKRPKLRVLDVDNKTEIRLSITTAGAAPGTLAITQGTFPNTVYLGGIRPDGTVVGDLARTPQRQELLLVVARDPMAAAKRFAAVMGYCCFCGKALEDAGSVQCGYGPVCAKHWGLPHTALGTSILRPREEV